MDHALKNQTLPLQVSVLWCGLSVLLSPLIKLSETDIFHEAKNTQFQYSCMILVFDTANELLTELNTLHKVACRFYLDFPVETSFENVLRAAKETT